METLKHIIRALSERERALFFAMGSVASASFIALATLVLSASTVEVPARGGEYVEGVLGQPAYVNPVLALGEVDKTLVRLTFSTLEELATKIEPDKEQTVWKVRLKEGLLWSDGRELTSDDIVFTVQKIQSPETQSPLFPLWQGVTVGRESELELKFTLASPYAFFPETLKRLAPIPRHIFVDVAPANWRLSDFNLAPVGSGPYQFSSYDKEPGGFIGTYTLRPNPHYAGEEPFIAIFSFRFFHEGEDLFAAFNGGGIDGFMSLQPEDVMRLARPYQTLVFNLPSYYAVFLNQNRNLSLKDSSVREALSRAVDRTAILGEVFGGHGSEANGPVPYLVTESSTIAEEKHRVDEAIRILDEDGWKATSSSAVREKKIKNSAIALELTLTVPDVPFLVKTANILKDSWERAGFRVNLFVLLPETIAETIIKNRDYEALLFGNVLGPNYDLFSFWHSSERFFPGLNLSLYNNKDADRLIESIRQNFDDAARKAELEKLLELILGDHPAVFLFSPDYLYIAEKKLRGIDPRLVPESSDRFQHAGDWYIKTARVLK